MTRLAKLALAALILWCLVSSPTLMPAVVAGPSCGAPVPLQLFGLALADRLRAAQPSWNVGIAGCYPTPLFSHAVIVAQAGESLDGAGLRPIPDARIHLTTHITGTFFGFDQPLDVWRPIDYVLPDRLSAGGSLRIGRAITVVGEAAHVNYSKMIGPNFQVVDFMAPSVGFSRANYFYRDVTEAHAGVEYRLVTRGHVVALRAGAFTDPEHRLHFIPQGQDRHIDNAQDLRFNTTPDRTRIGVTAGAGLTFNNKFQIDIAGTFVADARHLIVSVVRRLN